MMKVEEAKRIVEELRGRFDAPYSSSDKGRIVMLYWEVLGKEFKPTSCQQCYHDALIEIYVYLKRENKMKEKSNYRMKAGFIISCPEFDGGKVYTNDNMTDDVAERYLAAYPKNVRMFQVLPEGFDVKKVQAKMKKAVISSKNGGDGEKKVKKGNSKGRKKNGAETAIDGKTE